jgi:hypothetical protein
VFVVVVGCGFIVVVLVFVTCCGRHVPLLFINYFLLMNTTTATKKKE